MSNKTEKYQFELEGPMISQMQTLKRDLQILKGIKKELNKVNYNISPVNQHCNNSISAVKSKIGDLVAESYLKGLAIKN